MTGVVELPTWVPLAVLAGVLALVVVLVALWRSARTARRAADEALRAAAGETDALRRDLLALEQRLPAPAARPEVDDAREYVITGLAHGTGRTGPADRADAVPMLPTPVFADLVLRESVVRAAMIAAGVRRALSPQVRARVRVEMRREVKRARRERRAEIKEARREVQARRRAADAGGDPYRAAAR